MKITHYFVTLYPSPSLPSPILLPYSSPFLTPPLPHPSLPPYPSIYPSCRQTFKDRLLTVGFSQNVNYQVSIQLARVKVSIQLARVKVSIQLARVKVSIQLARVKVSIQLAMVKVSIQLALPHLYTSLVTVHAKQFVNALIVDLNILRGYSCVKEGPKM